MNAAGSRYDFSRTPLRGEDNTPLQQAVARWVIAHGGDHTLARVAAQASRADENGDSALRVEDAALRDALAVMPLVGDAASTNAPFVLDGELFYLRRNFARECAVATMLAARRDAEPCSAADPNPPEAFDSRGLFENPDDPAIAGQRQALEKIDRTRLFVLTGAPGSGKTTTVLRLLMHVARVHTRGRAGTWPRIALAAPTGKAAHRLRESLLDAASDGFSAEWQPALAAVQEQAANAGTVHRLLGLRAAGAPALHDAAHPLDADIVVIDEASMLDLALLRRLLSALRPDTRLILVGDADQLDSVGTGSVLQDIVAALGEDAPQLQRLHHSFRADRALLPLNEAVRRGDVAAFNVGLQHAGGQACLRQASPETELRALLREWSDALLHDIQAAGIDKAINAADSARIRTCLATLRDRQLLCALRDGPYGASGTAAAIEQQLARGLQDWRDGRGSEADHWYPGRRILITRNDPGSGLFNGDIGLCLDDGERLRVWFEGGDGEPRAFEIGTLPAHASAFALTVHKAQGSEYQHVAVLLPPQAEHPLLSRQWFYTAISRARRRLEIWGGSDALHRAIGMPARRTSGLQQRLEAAM